MLVMTQMPIPDQILGLVKLQHKPEAQPVKSSDFDSMCIEYCVNLTLLNTQLRLWGTVQLGGHFGFSSGYARGRDSFRPRGGIPFNLDLDSDDDSSVVRPASRSAYGRCCCHPRFRSQIAQIATKHIGRIIDAP